MKKSIICLSLILGLSVAHTYAQKDLAEYAETLSTEEGHKKLTKQGLVLHNYYAAAKYPSKYLIEKPMKFKRVGILSLMVRQDASVSTDPSKSMKISESGLQGIATQISGPVEKALKAAGKEKGIEILTPKEYLTSDELVEEYLSIKLEKGKMIEGKNVQAALGYRPFNQLVTEGSAAGLGGVTYKSFYTIGNLAKKCNLDAVIIVVVTTYSAVIQNVQRKLLYHRIAFSNFLVNQTPYMEDRKYPKLLGGYISLVQAGHSRFIAGGSPIMEFNKVGEEIISSEFKVNFAGGLRSEVVTAPKLNLVGDYTEDLGNVAGNFAKFYLDAANAYVEKINTKNKFVE